MGVADERLVQPVAGVGDGPSQAHPQGPGHGGHGPAGVGTAGLGRIPAQDAPGSPGVRPHRLTALLLVAAAAAVGPDPRGAWRILRRDAAKASSPNAGWPVAAMAGALGVRLGGPATYSGHRLDKPFIGDPPHTPLQKTLSGEKYRQAIRLLYAVSLLMAAITFLSLLASDAGVWGIMGWWR